MRSELLPLSFLTLFRDGLLVLMNYSELLYSPLPVGSFLTHAALFHCDKLMRLGEYRKEFSGEMRMRCKRNGTDLLSNASRLMCSAVNCTCVAQGKNIILASQGAVEIQEVLEVA